MDEPDSKKQKRIDIKKQKRMELPKVKRGKRNREKVTKMPMLEKVTC